MKAIIALGAVGLLAGCGQFQPPAAPQDAALAFAQRALVEHPVSRFVVAGTRQFPNGTEVYVLDGQTGQVCYYFIATGMETGPKAAKTDMRGCAGDALAPNF